jgi:hypothetical protein
MFEHLRGMGMRLRPFIIGFTVAIAALPALAGDRPFPQNARRGTMTPANYPEIVIDGQSRQLAPGARIWNTDNLIEMPAALRGSDLAVNYTEDPQGAVDRVWILSPEEASEPLAQQINRQLR